MERLLTSTRHRVVLYDELRGLMILSMLVYHLCYDLAELVELPGMGWFDSAAADVWQLSICGTFLLISGACCTFSRSNLRRGLRLLGLGILLTVVTALFVPDQLIVFGLLHFLGVAVLLTTLLKPLLERIPTAGGIVGMLVLFLLTDHLYDGWFGLTPAAFDCPAGLPVSEQLAVLFGLLRAGLLFLGLFPAAAVPIFVLGRGAVLSGSAACVVLSLPLSAACPSRAEYPVDLPVSPAGAVRHPLADLPLLTGLFARRNFFLDEK